MVIISASILSADFSDLKNEVKSVENSGADWLHLDVMDGHFVPNITFGPSIIKSIRPHTKLFFDTHLMISEPIRYIKEFGEAGSDMITIHYESDIHTHRTVDYIKSFGLKAGVAINPATPVSFLEEILPFCDMVLIMSVNPGFGAQKFIESSYNKVIKLKKLASEINPHVLIEIDGGVNSDTAYGLIKAGADVLVAGSYVFSGKNRKERIESLRKAENEIKI